MISGDISNIKKSTISRLEALFELPQNKDKFIDKQLLDEICLISDELNREISVLLTRMGRIADIAIGDSGSVSFPHLSDKRGEGLSGIRMVHTHPSGSPMLSDVDIGTLLSTRLDAMAAVSVQEGKGVAVSVGYVSQDPESEIVFGPFYANRMPHAALLAEIAQADARVKRALALKDTSKKAERAVLIGLNATDEQMKELNSLAKTAGAQVVEIFTQKRERDKRTYVGQGMSNTIALKCAADRIDVAIINDQLSPSEASNLEDILGVKVVDKTALILDIFASHALSAEGKLQVEMAQLKYYSTRLTGQGKNLSRLGGGIGTRGPGESKLETDRRVIKERLTLLRGQLKELEGQRELTRKKRSASALPMIAIVGYTNAGKSTLFNALASENVLAEDKLFATLDTTTRKTDIGTPVLLTDTVGFIRQLPAELIEAFRSTLNEVRDADIILHVIDASDEHADSKKKTVEDMLISLESAHKPTVYVQNKCDIADGDALAKGAIKISAKNRIGLDKLKEALTNSVKSIGQTASMVIPYDRGDILSYIKSNSVSAVMEHLSEGTKITATADASVFSTAAAMLNRSKNGI